MKKNRFSEPGLLCSADINLQQAPPVNIPVFLVVALGLLAVSVFPEHFTDQKNNTQASTDITGEFVWITGSSGLQKGLYLLLPGQFEKSFPGQASLAYERSRPPGSAPVVSAIDYSSGIIEPAALPPEVANIFFLPISINRAQKETLGSLPGIGPVLAERILQRRKTQGPFRTKSELLQITGIGPGKLAQLTDYIIID